MALTSKTFLQLTWSRNFSPGLRLSQCIGIESIESCTLQVKISSLLGLRKIEAETQRFSLEIEKNLHYGLTKCSLEKYAPPYCNR